MTKKYFQEVHFYELPSWSGGLVKGSHHTFDHIIYECPVTNLIAISVHRYWFATQNRMHKLEGGHVRPTPWPVDAEESQACARYSKEVRIHMCHLCSNRKHLLKQGRPNYWSNYELLDVVGHGDRGHDGQRDWAYVLGPGSICHLGHSCLTGGTGTGAPVYGSKSARHSCPTGGTGTEIRGSRMCDVTLGGVLYFFKLEFP